MRAARIIWLADYPVCGLSVHDRKLLMTNDAGRN
jgi:hypothetical protein